jgi:formylglycine-generating enzyme required for sulfatase activity
MRMSSIAVTAGSLLFAGLRAWAQATLDPPALCSASEKDWSAAGAADASQWNALLNRTPNACVNLRAEIERRIRTAETSSEAHRVQSEAHKVQTVSLPKRRRDKVNEGDGADALNAKEAHALSIMAPGSSRPGISSERTRVSQQPVRLRPGTIVQDCRNCPSMIAIPGGEFVMGSSEGDEGRARDEGPPTTILIAPMWISRFEITFDEWDECVHDGGCEGYSPPDSGWGRGVRPVIFVSWSDAVGYTAWLSRHSGRHYRLLSESEWEYAARAGTRGRYGFDGDVSQICKFGNVPDQTAPYAGSINCSDGFGQETAPVGQFRPNAFGLYDMIGNVSELVADCYHDSLVGEDPHGRPYQSRNCDVHIVKGSAWGLWQPESAYNEVRIAARFRVRDGFRHGGNGYGFRVARDIDN